jgi:hypothetical protein
MKSGEKAVALSNNLSFDMVLDRTCGRLRERQVQYSIRRIQNLEKRLAALERELDGLVILQTQRDALT